MHSPALCLLGLSALVCAAAFDLIFELFAGAEVAYLLFYAWKKSRAQPITAASAPQLSPGARRRLWQRCLASVPSPSDFAASWFRYVEDDESPVGHKAESCGRRMVSFCDLKRENVKDWVAWGLWSSGEAAAVDSDELEFYVDGLEKACRDEGVFKPGKGFPLGREKRICALKFSYEPVKCVWKPFVLFAFLEFLWFVSASVLFLRGFRYKAVGEMCYWIRKGTMSAPQSQSQSQSQSQTYTAATAKAQTEAGDSSTPIVLFHGIGIGVIPYIPTLFQLGSKEDWKRTWIAVETPEYPRICLSSAMSVPERYAADVKAILAKHNIDKATFIAHSMGSVYLNWIVQNSPRIVCDVVLIDPVCLLLHHTRCLWNFLYVRPPVGSGIELIVREWLILLDPNISYRLRRRFTWYQNILWIQDLPKDVRILVFLSENDEFVPSRHVADYLKACRGIKGDTPEISWLASDGLGSEPKALGSETKTEPKTRASQLGWVDLGDIDNIPVSDDSDSGCGSDVSKNKLQVVERSIQIGWFQGGQHGCCLGVPSANRLLVSGIFEFISKI